MFFKVFFTPTHTIDKSIDQNHSISLLLADSVRKVEPIDRRTFK